MKKLIVFLILSIVVVSCSSPAGKPQAPSFNPTTGATQAPASVIATTWKTYTNTEAGFSIRYPADWQEQDLPDENAGQLHQIALNGPEGSVELVWGVGLGGACPQGYQPMTVAKGSWPACHAQREDGTEMWSLEAQPIGNTSLTGFVNTNDAAARSREVVLQVISTLSFP